MIVDVGGVAFNCLFDCHQSCVSIEQDEVGKCTFAREKKKSFSLACSIGSKKRSTGKSNKSHKSWVGARELGSPDATCEFLPLQFWFLPCARPTRSEDAQKRAPQDKIIIKILGSLGLIRMVHRQQAAAPLSLIATRPAVILFQSQHCARRLPRAESPGFASLRCVILSAKTS